MRFLCVWWLECCDPFFFLFVLRIQATYFPVRFCGNGGWKAVGTLIPPPAPPSFENPSTVFSSAISCIWWLERCGFFLLLRVQAQCFQYDFVCVRGGCLDRGGPHSFCVWWLERCGPLFALVLIFLFDFVCVWWLDRCDPLFLFFVFRIQAQYCQYDFVYAVDHFLL